jgi:microcystin-dependent protein
MTNTEAPVSTGRGASAAADFAAHKTITIPDPRGRAIIGSGEGSGLTARTHGATGGAETHQLTTTEMPAHAHRSAWYDTTPSGTGGVGSLYDGSKAAFNTGDAGGGAAHANMQPWLALNLICKL